MAAAHHTTVHEDTAEKHEQHSDDGHQTRRSVGAGTTTTNGGPRRVKNLDNFDEKQSSGVLINSPRSLQACRKEGIDPAAELYYRDLKSFVLQCKGDVDVAKVKHRHYMERRAEALEMVRARRRELIEEAAQDEMGSTKQPSPAEFQAQNSTNGEDGRPLAGGSDQGDENASLTSSQSPRQREKSQPKGGSTSPLSPEEFQRQQAEAKRLKVARQVDKMKRVAEQNKQREEAQLEHMAAMRRQMKQQEIERQEQLEREEVMRYLRERAARKRDAELAIQKEQREAATEARMEDLRLQREAKEQQLRLKEQERLRREEQRRIEREEEMERQREEQRRRLQGIYEQNEELIALKAEDLAARMAFAEEQRQKLQAQRDEELRQRKEYNARKQAESEEKRRRANAQHESRIGGYVHRAEHVKKAMEEREQHRQNLLELKRLEEEENERRRQEIRRQVLAEEKAHQLELQKRLEEEDRRRQEENARRQQEAKLRLAQKEIEVEDRVALVKRMQLRLENDCFEAGMRYEAKMSRIEELRHEMKKADEDRKKLQYEMVKHKLPPGAFQHPTPGPGEYAVVDAERKLAAGPSVRMGGAPVKSRRPKLVGDAPGPGAYSVPISAIRAHKGAKLPPRHATAVDMQQKRAASALAILPPVKGAKHSRSPTQVGRSASAAPSSAVSPTKSADRPAELRDEDFATDDEYDDA